MKVIPAINETDFSKIKEKLEKAAEFSSPAGGWAQIDIADGKFTSHKTWNNPKDLLDIRNQFSSVNLEIHLMVEEPEAVVDDWIETGAKRIIIHDEAIRKSAAKNLQTNEIDILNFIIAKCEAKEVELGLAINPETPVEELVPHLDKIRFIQILAVNPGLAGQQFRAETLKKIKFIKELNESYFDTIVEVDGGINLEIAKICKEAGADVLAAASYIWNSKNPEKAYKELADL